MLLVSAMYLMTTAGEYGGEYGKQGVFCPYIATTSQILYWVLKREVINKIYSTLASLASFSCRL